MLMLWEWIIKILDAHTVNIQFSGVQNVSKKVPEKEKTFTEHQTESKQIENQFPLISNVTCGYCSTFFSVAVLVLENDAVIPCESCAFLPPLRQ